ncbi:hypothetical protein ACLB2K_004822 [Fragaria x ananassa]
MTVMAFEQRFRELSYYVPDLVKSDQENIYQFTKGLGVGMVAVQVQDLVLEGDSRGMVVGPSRISLGVSLSDSGVDQAVGVGLLVDSLFSLRRVSISQGDVFSVVSWTISRGIALF